MSGMALRLSRPTLAAVAALATTIGGVVGGMTASAGPAAADVPPTFTDTLVAGGLSAPTAMALAPAGRTFVAEQGGRLRVIANGSLLAAPFLTVPTTATGERGLLGVTFDPDFATDQHVYVYYTATGPQVHNRLSRFTANGNVAVPGSERILLELDNLSATNHNGGALHFGADGKLYVAVGENATPSNAQSLNSTQPLTYRWQRDGVDIPGATGASYTTAPTVPADDGATFRVIVSNSAGSVTSATATLTVTAGRPPTGVITAPATDATYIAGSSIAYAGTATDPDDGTLPESAFTWQVDFHHADHVHPFLPPTTGSSTGSFTFPDVGETATNLWYRIILTVRDSTGPTQTTIRDVTPLTTTLTVETDPAGLQVTVDGQPRTAPFEEPSVVGMKRSLGAPSPQASGGRSYAFSSWSDGGAATHTVITPASPTVYRATLPRSRPRRGGSSPRTADCRWTWSTALRRPARGPCSGRTRGRHTNGGHCARTTTARTPSSTRTAACASTSPVRAAPMALARSSGPATAAPTSAGRSRTSATSRPADSHIGRWRGPCVVRGRKK